MKGDAMPDGLWKDVLVSQWAVDEWRVISVRLSTRIYDGQALLSETYHRVAYSPGDPVDGADATTQAIAGAIWTPEVIARRQAEMEALAASEQERAAEALDAAPASPAPIN